jgi:serine/threonine protein kinase
MLPPQAPSSRLHVARYLAPEVVLCSGHGFGCDWWALGVLLYEMLHGATPFADAVPLSMYGRIVRRELCWPRPLATQTGSASRELLERLLTVDVAQRLGMARKGIADVKEHAFFGQLDWEALLHKRVPAPWSPKLVGTSDTSRFPPMHEGSAAIEESEPLSEHEARRVDALFDEF